MYARARWLLVLAIVVALAFGGVWSGIPTAVVEAQQDSVDLAVYTVFKGGQVGPIGNYLVVANHGGETAYGVRVEIELSAGSYIVPDFIEDTSHLPEDPPGQLQVRDPSHGAVEYNVGGDPHRAVWKVGRLAARSEHRVDLDHVLRLSQNMRISFVVGNEAPEEPSSALHDNLDEYLIFAPSSLTVQITGGDASVQAAASPQVGGNVIFDITASLQNVVLPDVALTYLLDAMVETRLTGLEYLSHEVREEGTRGTITRGDDGLYSPSTGTLAIGYWRSGRPEKFHLELTTRPVAGAAASEQCLTAELSGFPEAPGAHGVDARIDNVARVCVDEEQTGAPVPTVLSDGEVSLFTWYDCVGQTDYPCDRTNNANEDGLETAVLLGKVATNDIEPYALRQPSEVWVHIQDPVGRIFAASTIFWSTGWAGQRDGTRVNITTKDVFGSTGWDPPPSTTNLELLSWPEGGDLSVKWTSGATVNDLWDFNAATQRRASGGTFNITDFLLLFQFTELGQYRLRYNPTAVRSGTTHSDTEIYTFHVGPIADLAVHETWQTAEGLSVAVVNNGPNTSPGARVVLENGESCLLASMAPLEGRTCTIAGGSLTGPGTVENHVPYEVCIDPTHSPGHGDDDDDGTIDAASKSECEDPPNNGSWHSVAVYDHDPNNNAITGLSDAAPVPGSVGAQTRQTRMFIDWHTVSWEPVAKLYSLDVAHYQVERLDPERGVWKLIAAVRETSYDDTDEERGSSPRYRVRAVNTLGQFGPWAETGVSGTGGLPRVTLALDPATIKEPDDDAPDAVSTATVTATLNRASAQNIEVVVSAAPASGIDPAEEGDYTLSDNTTLTIPAGQQESTGVVTITANEDADAENERVTITAVAAHAQPNITPVTLTIDDDDNPGLTLGALNPAQVPEGLTAAYTVKLDAAPPENMDVTVRLTSNNSDVTVDTDTAEDGLQDTLTFTSVNWNMEQTVTVSAAQDADAADDTASVTHQASGPFEYQSVRASLPVTVSDDDTAGVTVSDAGITVEEGKSGTYNVRLNTEPAGSVVITVTSDHPSVTVSPSRFSLGRSNWQTGRDVTVYVRNDNDAAVIAATLTHAVDAGATSADEYDGVTIASVSVSVTDDEAPTDYDGDNDGLLEISTAAQLNALRWDLDGNGKPDAGPTGNEAKDYARAFPRIMQGMCDGNPDPATTPQGDPGNCTGYELANDIRLSGSWTPIDGFSATLEGNGNVISGLSISRGNDDQPVGMFAYNTGTIQNLGLEGVNVRGEASVGALAGRNGGTITGAWSTGRVSGNAHVGGLVGSNRGTVERSYSAARVTGVVLRDSQGPLWSVRTAGLVGLNWGTVRNTYAVGDVTGHGHVSGLVGWNDRSGEIINSYAAGKLTAEFSAGGLVGWQTASVTGSYWDTEATGVKDGAAQGSEGGMTGLDTDGMQALTAPTGWGAGIWKFTPDAYPCLVDVTPGCSNDTGRTAPNRGSDSVGYALARSGAAWAVSAPVSYVYDWGIAENLTLRDLWRRPRRSGRRAGRQSPTPADG